MIILHIETWPPEYEEDVLEHVSTLTFSTTNRYKTTSQQLSKQSAVEVYLKKRNKYKYELHY